MDVGLDSLEDQQTSIVSYHEVKSKPGEWASGCDSDELLYMVSPGGRTIVRAEPTIWAGHRQICSLPAVPSSNHTDNHSRNTGELKEEVESYFGISLPGVPEG
jgi:hypothetical protein